MSLYKQKTKITYDLHIKIYFCENIIDLNGTKTVLKLMTRSY